MADSILDRLDSREWTTLSTLFSEPGLHYRDVAKKLDVREGTIRHRMWRIFNKTGVGTKEELTASLTPADREALANPGPPVPVRQKRRLYDAPRLSEYAYGSLSPKARAELAAQIQRDAEEIAVRVGCPNRLVGLLPQKSL